MQATRKYRAEAPRASLAELAPYWVHRLAILLAGMMAFFAPMNPGRIFRQININASLFTTAFSYETVATKIKRPLSRHPVLADNVNLLMIACAVIVVGILLCAAGGCMSAGNNRMKKRGIWFPLAGSAAMLAGLFMIRNAHASLTAYLAGNKVSVDMMTPPGLTVFTVTAAVILLTTLVILPMLFRKKSEARMEMQEKYKLFLMFLPVLLLTFLFCYLPIYGWRFAFYDYQIGDELTPDKFVGFRYFTQLVSSDAMRADLGNVLVNTLAMSGLGILTSWLPIAFAVLLAEVPSTRYQRVVQTLTTIPNFISWVLVYAIAFAIFSTDGFINNVLTAVTGTAHATDYLADPSHTWLKMLLWGTWKGVGWSAIIYIAGIAGIDQQLYEAASVDGAGRFRRIWHITIPGLLPTYMVMLLMSIAGILSNGMEQYLVFKNPQNESAIKVLDLYVYMLGLGSNQIPTATVVGIAKSLVGVVLLFGANGISKLLRGESII